MINALPTAEQRLQQIASDRHAVFVEGRSRAGRDAGEWIESSWLRCLARGQRPQQRVSFDAIPAQAPRRIEEANHTLIEAARPVLTQLGRALAHSRYFAVLTDTRGVVIGVDGPIDRSDRRANVITRVGADLSEPAIGTSAISAALREHRAVWLHRGEHFFDDTSVYSCAGAPLFGPDAQCIGMLDLTGIDAIERPELMHLVSQSARSIENALTLRRPHSLLLRLNWPGYAIGGEFDGLVCLDADGAMISMNRVARVMLPDIGAAGETPMHGGGLFATPWASVFDAADRGAAVAVTLWSGLTLQVLVQTARGSRQPSSTAVRLPLRDVETALIRKAVDEAHGNVMQAARVLGISRATVYRKLRRSAAQR